jgi:hypothetical protein
VVYDDDDEEEFDFGCEELQEIIDKAREEASVGEEEATENSPRYSIGTKVKRFIPGQGYFSGIVSDCSDEVCTVRYEDGDEEVFFVGDTQLDASVLAAARDLPADRTDAVSV